MVDGHAGRVQEKDRYSRGRNQPYAGHRSHLVDQKPNPMGEDPKITNDKIQGSFFEVNIQKLDGPATMGGKEPNPPSGFPYDWLCFADRPLISAAELMMVPARPAPGSDPEVHRPGHAGRAG